MTVVFSVRSSWSFGISNSTSDRLLKVQSAFSNQVSVEWNIYTLFQYVTWFSQRFDFAKSASTGPQRPRRVGSLRIAEASGLQGWRTLDQRTKGGIWRKARLKRRCIAPFSAKRRRSHQVFARQTAIGQRFTLRFCHFVVLSLGSLRFHLTFHHI